MEVSRHRAEEAELAGEEHLVRIYLKLGTQMTMVSATVWEVACGDLQRVG